MKIISSFVNLSQFITIVILLISSFLFGKPVDRSLPFLSISKVQNDTLPPVKTENGIASDESAIKVYTFVEHQPEYPEGTAALFKWIVSNLVYPKEAREKGIEGTTYIGFVVEKDGSINEIMVKRGIKDGKMLDEEAMRVIKMMPKWNPGKDKDGNPLRVFFTLPIKFKA